LLGFFGLTTLTSQFFPEADRNQFYIQLHLPTQTPIAQTYQLARQAHDLIVDHEQITSLHWYIGKSAAKFYYNQLMNQDGTANFAEAQVTTSTIDTVRNMVPKLQSQLDKAFPQAQIMVRELKQGPPTNAPVEIRLFGSDISTLKGIGEEVRLRLSQIPAITHSRASLGGGEPKLWFNANEDELRLTDLQLVDVAQNLNDQLDGAVNGSLVEANQELPVRIRVADRQRSDLANLASMHVAVPRKDNHSLFPGIPLTSVGTLSLQPEADNITRRDGERVNVISAYLKAGMLPATALEQFQSLWKQQPLPLGYRMEFGGDSEARADALTDLVRSVPLFITLSLGLLVVTFNSFRLAGIIVLVAVQSFGLGLLALTIFQYPFGFQPIIGLIGLTGIAVNAAIIILSALRLEPSAMTGDIDTIRATVMASSRHIISTTITTFGGFLPLMLAEGGFWPPFAAAIAGGVLLSTVVSFYFVPPCFLLFTQRRGISASQAGNHQASIAT
jgi:multidrug efflux pump subunit AcrB